MKDVAVAKVSVPVFVFQEYREQYREPGPPPPPPRRLLFNGFQKVDGKRL